MVEKLPRFNAAGHTGDLIAGASVAVVLIPQSLAYAALAGLPPNRGLYVAALAPLTAALFASSPYLGTGPTAVTSLLALGGLAAIAQPGDADYVALAALLAVLVGVIRVILGVTRSGVIAYLMSGAVVVGFTSGVAMVIIASQIPTVLGVRAGEGHFLEVALRTASQPSEWDPFALSLAVLAGLAIAGGRKLHRHFPGVLVAVGAAIICSRVVGYTGPVVGRLSDVLPSLSLGLPWAATPQLLAPALVIGLLGFAEPASIARKYATLDRQHWNPNRELIAQGAANLAAGVAGGFPVGGSFSRTSLARSLKAKTRLSGAVTGLVVLAFLPFASVLAPMPFSVLGAIIIVSVIDLVQLKPFLELRSYTKLQFRIAVLTFVLTIAFAPHVERGVIAGISLAIGAHLWRELRILVPTSTTGRTLHLEPKGVLYFASGPGLEDAFSKLLHEHPKADRLVIHLDGLGRIDLSGALVIRGLKRDAEEAGLEVEIVDVPPQSSKIMERVIDPPQ
ncbi:MAG: SulP family inorganic anion transporter [Actinobacteria bacterium]|nr:SulP family inorganic anion transporter [Actinomycetota bacterium]